jgi:LysM repeat protein
VKLYYTKQGDHLFTIAERKQVSIADLQTLNPELPEGELRPGIKVKIPDERIPLQYPLPPLHVSDYPGLGATTDNERFESDMRGFQYHCAQIEKPEIKKTEKKTTSENECTEKKSKNTSHTTFHDSPS